MSVRRAVTSVVALLVVIGLGGSLLLGCGHKGSGISSHQATTLAFTTDKDLPQGKQYTNYNTTFQAMGGTGPYTFNVPQGGLPKGLTLTAAGVLLGDPLVFGYYTFTVDVADSAGANVKKDFTMLLNSYP